MAKYLLLKHYQGAPEPVNCVPMSEWTPEEFDVHVKFMQDFGSALERTGELVDAQALAPEGRWVTAGADGQPVTPEEIEAAEEAIQGCPVEAIGNDGGEAA